MSILSKESILNIMIIDNTHDLKSLCNRFEKEKFITVDTEFIRERTYYAELCLIQVASPSEAWCIDPLAPDINLSPLVDLMKNQNVLKVFHAARQDIEIFYEWMKVVPTPLFDTQIGAMVCGFGDSASYQLLVSSFVKVNLDKTTRFTDWSHRPLAEKQIQYALSDVTYLVHVYEKIKDILHKKNRETWVSEEMVFLTDPRFYQVHLEEKWKKIKSHSTNPRFLAILREVCAWRENKAMQQNKPRKHILKDEALIEIAAMAPLALEQLQNLRSMNAGTAKHFGTEIIKAIQKGQACPDDKCPHAENKKLEQGNKNIVEILKLILSTVCEQEKVAPKIVANNTDLEMMALSDNATVPAMMGWRYDLFGKKAVDFKQGRLVVRFNPKSKKAEFIVSQI